MFCPFWWLILTSSHYLSFFSVSYRMFSHPCCMVKQWTLICLTWFTCPKRVVYWQKRKSKGSSAAWWALSCLSGMRRVPWSSYRGLCRTGWSILEAWSECLCLLVLGKQVRTTRISEQLLHNQVSEKCSGWNRLADNDPANCRHDRKHSIDVVHHVETNRAAY